MPARDDDDAGRVSYDGMGLCWRMMMTLDRLDVMPTHDGDAGTLNYADA